MTSSHLDSGERPDINVGMLVWPAEKGNQLGNVRLNFDHTTKGYMHKPESDQKNETHKIICDFGIQAH